MAEQSLFGTSDEESDNQQHRDLELRIKTMSAELSALRSEFKALKAKIYLRNTQKK